jgi:glucose/mannose-6-phosphate isomerase
MSPTASDGPARMRALAASLPRALEDGFRSGRELAPPARDGRSAVVAVGMGGSGIAADLARGFVVAESPVALSVCRSPELPRSVDAQTYVILVSYSGNTWETLQAYDAAGRAGALRTVVTSGGVLAERAVRDGVPILPVPPGLPPRATVGQQLGGLIGLLDPWFPESNEARVGRVGERVSDLIATYARARGPAAALAEKVGDRLPFVYAESAFLGLARRWKTQVEENAKRLAVFDEVPELFHNAIVGWDATRRTEASRYAVLLLEWAGEGALTRQSFRYLETLLRRRGARVLKVPLSAEDRLEALVGGISLGDYVSLFLADRRHVDPLPVEAITRLKAALGSPGPRPRK